MLLKYFIRNICCLLFILVCLGVYANAQSNNTDITFTIIDKEGHKLVDDDKNAIYDKLYTFFENKKIEYDFTITASEFLTDGEICFKTKTKKAPSCIKQGENKLTIIFNHIPKNDWALKPSKYPDTDARYYSKVDVEDYRFYKYSTGLPFEVDYANTSPVYQSRIKKLLNMAIKYYDDDTVGFIVTHDAAGNNKVFLGEQKRYELAEKDGKQVFYVALKSQPLQGKVIVNVISSDNTQGDVFPKKLTFTKDDWNDAQVFTVTAKDNDIAGDNKPYDIKFAVDDTLTTADEYKNWQNNINLKPSSKPSSIKIINTDDDKAGFEVTTDEAGNNKVSTGTTYEINEKDDEQVFYVALTSEPSKGKVTVNVSSSDDKQGEVLPKTLTFNESNWERRQRVTVTAKDNDIAGDNKPYYIKFKVDSSNSDEYSNAKIKPLKIQNNDNDTAGFIVTHDEAGNNKVSAEKYEINEKDDEQVFYVALTSEPSKGEVIVNVKSSNIDQGGVSNGKLIFTKNDWSQAHGFTVTAKDNDIAGDNEEYDIKFKVDSSGSVEYSNAKIKPLKIQNNDNDTAGFIVTHDEAGNNKVSAGTTYEINEKDDEQVFYVALTSEPSKGKVIVNVKSSNIDQGGVSNGKLIFTKNDWSQAHGFTVTAKDNYIVGKNASYDIDFIVDAKLTKAAEYKPLTIPSIKIQNDDNDTAGFIVTHDAAGNNKVSAEKYEINEKDDEQKFYVALTSEPSKGKVIVNVKSSNIDQGGVSNGKLIFTKNDWSQAHGFTVTAKDNDIAGDNEEYDIKFKVDSSGSVEYSNAKIKPLKIQNNDNDTAGFIVTHDEAGNNKVSAEKYEINEKDDEQKFYVALTSEPSKGKVIVNVKSSNIDQGGVSNGKLIFTKNDWSQAHGFTVTAKDNDIAGDNEEYDIKFKVDSSNSDEYSNAKIKPLKIQNNDNDKAGFKVTTDSEGENEVIAETKYEINEKDDEQVFYVALTSKPSKGTVTVNVSSSNIDQGTVLPKTWTFDAKNWSSTKRFTVTAKDNNIAGDNEEYDIKFAVDDKLTTADEYKNWQNSADFKPSSIKIINTDDNADTAGFKVTTDEAGNNEVSAGTYEIDEKDDEQKFYVALTSEPSKGEVIVNVSSSDDTQGGVSNGKLIFTKNDWNTRQEVKVTTKDNDIAGDNKPYYIKFKVDSSKSVEYSNAEIEPLKIQNNDNDTAGFKVTTDSEGENEVIAETKYEINEKDDEQVFYVALTSKPSKGKVIVNVKSSNIDQGTVLPKTLTFNESNWERRQRVTVTAINNDIAGDNKSYNIKFVVDSSSSNEYSNAEIKPLKIQNNDNDTAGFKVTTDSEGENEVIAETKYEINEKDDEQVFYVALTSEPSKGEVIVNVKSSNSDQGGVSNGKLIFTKDNWSQTREVTVTAKDNDIAGDNEEYDIKFKVDSSGSVEYSNAKIKPLKIQNNDNDTAGFKVTTDSEGENEVIAETKYEINEKDDEQVFYVALTSEPSKGEVIVNVSSSDDTQGGVSNGKLIFTKDNWSQTREVKVTTKDNDIAGDNKPYYIKFKVDSSKSVEYSNAEIEPLKIQNNDNDTAGFKVTTDSEGENEVIAETKYEINEKDDEQVFYVALTSKPSKGTVTVNVNSSNIDQGTVLPKTWTFDAKNWSSTKRFTVTAKDNDIAGDNKSYDIKFVVNKNSVTANEYKDAIIKPLKIQNNDNDTAGFKVTTDSEGENEVIAETKYEIEEEDGKQIFYVALTSKPSKGTVTVNVNSSNIDQGEVLPKTWTFDAKNWSGTKRFTVTAKDNNIAGDNTPYDIKFKVNKNSVTANEYKDLLNSTDFKPPSIQIINNDDDTAGFKVTTDIEGKNEVIPKTTYEIEEEDGKQIFYVALTSEPSTGKVTVNVSSSDDKQGEVLPKTLTFDESNWNTRQEVKVTAKDNYIVGKNASYDIDFIVDGKLTKAAEYKPLTIPSIKIQNDDDDLNKVGTITIVQQFADPNRIFSYTINLSEIIKFNLKSENGVGKKTFRNIFAGTHVITQEDITLMGYGVTSIVCNDNNSVVELASRKVMIKLEKLEDVVCTFNIVESRKHTSNLIFEYLGLRNSLLLAHAPNIDLRIWRFDNEARNNDQSTGSISAFGKVIKPPISVNMAIEKNSVKFNSLLNKNSNKHKLDIWAQGNISRITTNKNQKGVFGVLYGGIDFLLNSNTLVGGIVQYDLFFQKSYAQHRNEIKGQGWMLGPYVLIKLYPKLYTDARVAWGVSNNKNKPFNTYEDKFRTTRFLATSSLIGKHFIGNWIISPVIKLNYIEENQESYIDSLGVKIPNQKLSQGSIQLNSRISYKHILDNKLEILPWLELKGNYSFFNKKSAFFNKTLLLGKSSILKQVEDSKKLIGSIKLGLDVIYHTGLKFTLASNINGINSYWKSFGIELNLNVPIS